MKVSASLCLIIAALALSAASADDEQKGDLSRFQGTWSAKTGPGDAWTVKMTFKGKAVKIAWPTKADTTLELTSELKIDESSQPKQLEFTKLRKADGSEVENSAGIYAIEGDGIKICIAEPGATRPTEFKGSGTDERYPSLLLLKPQPATVEGDLAAFQGTWVAKTGPGDAWEMSMTVKGRSCKTIWPKDSTTKYEIEGELRLDEKADPKQIDFLRQVRSTGEAVKDTAAIYAIEEGRIKICVARPGTERPVEFKGSGSDKERFPSFLILKKK